MHSLLRGRHSRESGNLGIAPLLDGCCDYAQHDSGGDLDFYAWIPAFAGMTRVI